MAAIVPITPGVLHILHKVHDLNIVHTMHDMRTIHAPARDAERDMKKKDDWVTREQVAEECEKLLAEGKPIHAINANMVIDRLRTKGRRTVYKYVEMWRTSKLGAAPLPPFVLDEENGRRLVAIFTGMLGEIVRDDRQAAADLVAVADQRAAAAESDRHGLLVSLEATEQERDDAMDQLRVAQDTIEKIRMWGTTQEVLAATFRQERDDLLKRYMPPAPAVANDVTDDDTLRCLETSHPEMMPEPKPVCVSCPVSNWYVADDSLGCYCKAMHKYPWTPGRSLPLCDTRQQAREALLASRND